MTTLLFFFPLIPMLTSLIWGGLVGSAIGFAIHCFIDDGVIKETVEEEYPDAFKILIKKKKKKAVAVGIFDVEDDLINDMVIESDQGISDSIYEGQELYL